MATCEVLRYNYGEVLVTASHCRNGYLCGGLIFVNFATSNFAQLPISNCCYPCTYISVVNWKNFLIRLSLSFCLFVCLFVKMVFVCLIISKHVHPPGLLIGSWQKKLYFKGRTCGHCSLLYCHKVYTVSKSWKASLCLKPTRITIVMLILWCLWCHRRLTSWPLRWPQHWWYFRFLFRRYSFGLKWIKNGMVLLYLIRTTAKCLDQWSLSMYFILLMREALFQRLDLLSLLVSIVKW